jgi:hypothetical protein
MLCCCLLSLAGCSTVVPRAWLPGRYTFHRKGYESTLILSPNRHYVITRRDPRGVLQVIEGTWSFYDEDHLFVPAVLPFYADDGVSPTEQSFWTPEFDIMWGRVCLLVDGDKDLFMCR